MKRKAESPVGDDAQTQAKKTKKTEKIEKTQKSKTCKSGSAH